MLLVKHIGPESLNNTPSRLGADRSAVKCLRDLRYMDHVWRSVQTSEISLVGRHRKHMMAAIVAVGSVEPFAHTKT